MRGGFAKNVLWLLSGNGLKFALQAAYFTLIARSLGPDKYGAFLAGVAITAVLSPFVGLGTSNLIVRNVARDPDLFRESWGNGLLVTFTTGVLGVGLVLAVRHWIPSGIGSTVLLLIAVADLVFGRITDLCGFAFGALERFGTTAHINVWISLSRVVGLSALVAIVPHPTVEAWAAAYLATAVATTFGSISWAFWTLSLPMIGLRRLFHELGEGIYFSIGLSAQSVYNDIDKTMLAQLGSLQATGIYGAAYRVIDVSTVPLRSILSAANPGSFRAGSRGIAESLAFMRPLMHKALMYSACAAAGMIVCAPILPHVLGPAYQETATALRWLAVLPVLRSVHLFLADALTGAGHQRMRSIVQVFIALVNILINIWIIPLYSWRGAAWSSIACDALLGVVLGTAAFQLTKAERMTIEITQEAV
jgi:O-antigen/teichoic acid export membrane protein